MLVRRTTIVTLTILLTLLSSIVILYALNPGEYHDQVTVTSIAPITSTLQSNRYTQMDDLTPVLDNPYTDLEDHRLLDAVNHDTLALYVNPETLTIRVVNKETGYIWASDMTYDYLDPEHPQYNPADIGTTPALIRENQSPVQISYYNLNSNNVTQRFTEFFFENTISGLIQNYTEYSDKNGFEANLTMPISKIKLKLKVYLDDDGLNVEVPNESITDNNNFLISTLSVYHLFGFAKDTYTPGYMMIPDGVGALIRFGGKNIIPYSKKFYGSDITLDEWSNEQPLTAKVYGMVHGVNSHAFLGIVESGAANGMLSFLPASNATQSNFNRAQTSFEYRTSYAQKLNASGTNVVLRVQANRNQFDIHLKYLFLSDDKANYVGMANRYREYLINQGVNLTPLQNQSDIPLHIDVLATENRRTWYGQEVFTMTTANQLKSILEDLNQVVSEIDVAVHGFQQGGMTGTAPNFNRVESLYGNPKVLDDLDYANIHYAVNPLIAFQGQGGYQANQVVQSLGRELISLGGETYLLKPNQAYFLFSDDFNELVSQGIKHISYQSLSFLFSDYSDQVISRSQQINEIEKFLTLGNQTMVSQPMDYLWDADVLNDLALYSSQQLKFTDTVPFIPLVLAGHKKTYGRSGNFFSNTSNELLRMVDYQIMPSFFVTHESSHLLLNTGSSYIFTSRYSDWENEIKRQYQFVNEALSHVYNAYIVERVVLSPGVIKNTYSNDVVIYINYSGSSYVDGAVTIDALDYEVIL